MQFTEISELRTIVEIIRSQAQSSPIFHDRHDSEVDRLYNSSPEASTESLEKLIGPHVNDTSQTVIGTSSKPVSDIMKEEKTSGAVRGAGKGGCKIVYFDARKDKVE